MKAFTSIVTAIILSLVASATIAGSFTNGSITITDPWSRETPPGVSKAVAYMNIANNGDSDVTLTDAEVTKAGDVTLHQSKVDGDMVTMRLVEGGLTIPAGESVSLEPRGYHFMLEDLDRGLVRNESVAMTVFFDGADAVNIKVQVKSMGAMDH
ncbi:copper chaperone PCu(A)C [Marinobacter sp. CHS3-4]|uniref:copper chaperone PCu(A)C n=1 Tax=Marinobacter sp. CHS3-4 TaxID=3045174 RepID=UPI0024B4E698|nr:copper chaperone PCu(A)C [Marinobacter sp. CHS3-4]MDI9246062.1 copper chaperone PCu(A)C [Marinobacter sp. CHS3-4]